MKRGDSENKGGKRKEKSNKKECVGKEEHADTGRRAGTRRSSRHTI
jgi:hypothetical protein